jgi:uncharacterized protein YbcI
VSSADQTACDRQVAGPEQGLGIKRRSARNPPNRAHRSDAADEHRAYALGEPELMSASEQLHGGELNAAITRALVGIQNEYVGRGPRQASTFYHNNVIVTLMHDVLNRAEKEISKSNRTDAVTSIRHLYQMAMQADFTEAVERLSGRKVIAFISGNHADPDIATEVFVLDAAI